MQSRLSESRTASPLAVPIIPLTKLTPVWSRSFSMAGVVSVGLNWSSSIVSSSFTPGTRFLALASLMYALKPDATGAKAAATAPPDRGIVEPIFTVPVILSLTSDGQFDVSTLYAPDVPLLDDEPPPEPPLVDALFFLS